MERKLEKSSAAIGRTRMIPSARSGLDFLLHWRKLIAGTIEKKEDSMRWRKTAEEPPMEKNGNQYGDVLVLDASLEGFVTNKGWLYVKRAPDIYPIWMPIPKPPKSYLEDE